MEAITLKPTTEFDLVELSWLMRKEDRDEVYAATGREALEELLDANAVSRDTYTARSASGKLLCCLGLKTCTIAGEAAFPWFLSSIHLPEHPRALMKYSRQAVEHWSQKYDLLVNFVDMRYTASVRWVKKLGFTVYDPQPYGPFGVLFHRFEMRKK